MRSPAVSTAPPVQLLQPRLPPVRAPKRRSTAPGVHRGSVGATRSRQSCSFPSETAGMSAPSNSHRSKSNPCNSSRRAAQARESRERTVPGGISSATAISSWLSSAQAWRSRISRCSPTSVRSAAAMRGPQTRHSIARREAMGSRGAPSQRAVASRGRAGVVRPSSDYAADWSRCRTARSAASRGQDRNWLAGERPSQRSQLRGRRLEGRRPSARCSGGWRQSSPRRARSKDGSSRIGPSFPSGSGSLSRAPTTT